MQTKLVFAWTVTYETAKQHAQTIVRGVGTGVDDSVSLDVHAKE